jgi:hypothetical protein
MSVVEKTKLTKEREVKKKNAKEKKKMTIDIMSDDKYRSCVLQPVINEIARIIDFGQPCIATLYFCRSQQNNLLEPTQYSHSVIRI